MALTSLYSSVRLKIIDSTLSFEKSGRFVLLENLHRLSTHVGLCLYVVLISYPPRRLRQAPLTTILVDPHADLKQPRTVTLHELHLSSIARIWFKQFCKSRECNFTVMP